MSDPKDCQALLFDVFGTCVDWRTGVIREVAAAAATAGVALDAAAFADAWRGLYQPGMEAVRQGRRPWTILDQLHRESLDLLLSEFGVDDAFDLDARAALTRAWWRLDPWPDVVPGLTRLKARRFVAPCSNGNVALIANMAKRAGLPWDLVLGAEVAGAYKPQKEAYQRSAMLLGLAPEQCLFVAAHNDDLFAARYVGMPCVFVARPTEHGPGQTTDLQPIAGWDLVASDFGDLADQLGA